MRVDAQQLQTFGGTQNLTYRAYPRDADQTVIATNPRRPGCARSTYQPPAPTAQYLVVNYPNDLRLGGSQGLVATSDSGLPVAFESRTPVGLLGHRPDRDRPGRGRVHGARQPGRRRRRRCHVRRRPVGRPYLRDLAGARHPDDYLRAARRHASRRPGPGADRLRVLAPERAGRVPDAERLHPSTATAATRRGQSPEDRVRPGRGAAPLECRRGQPGQCPSAPPRAGNADWDWVAEVFNPAHPVERTFTVRGATDAVAQSVAVSGSRGVALSSRTAPVRFTSSAGLPVQVASSTPAVCSWKKAGSRAAAQGRHCCAPEPPRPLGNAAYLAARRGQYLLPGVEAHPALPNSVEVGPRPRRYSAVARRGCASVAGPARRVPRRVRRRGRR